MKREKLNKYLLELTEDRQVLTWHCGVSDHFWIFVHIDIGAKYCIVEGKKWKAIVAGKVSDIKTSCNCLCTEIAHNPCYQMREPKVGPLAQAYHIGAHISQAPRVIDVLPAVN